MIRPHMRVVQPDHAVHQEHRDGDHHRRQHARREDEEEQVPLPLHLEAREAVGGDRAHADGQHRRVMATISEFMKRLG
jgi:hypothetical protein